MRLGLHGKSIVIDDRVSVIGSHNFDPRSDDYNTESGFIIYDRAVADALRAEILRDTEPQNAWTIGKRQRRFAATVRSETAVAAVISVAAFCLAARRLETGRHPASHLRVRGLADLARPSNWEAASTRRWATCAPAGRSLHPGWDLTYRLCVAKYGAWKRIGQRNICR